MTGTPLANVISCLAILLALSSGSLAAEKAKPVSKAERSGFVIVASIVTNPDWMEKWNTPSDTTPHFNTPGVMKMGDKAWLLTVFSGAAIKDGVASLNCDLTIRNPDGTIDRHPPQLCFQGPVSGPEGMLFMTGMQVALEVAPTDLSGLVEFEIGITDINRDLRVPVTVSVEFETGSGRT